MPNEPKSVDRVELGADKASANSGLERSLGLFSAVTIVVGSMIGSGIFLVTPDVARSVETTGLLIALWVFTGLLTIFGATSYGKLAAYMPKAGGQYVFLREAWGDIPAFLYGWVFFWVIQTGLLAAVAVAFARYVGVLLPAVNKLPMFMIFPAVAGGEPLFFTTEKLLMVLCLVALTVFNTMGLKYGALLQNVFTSLKVLALFILICVGLALGQNIWGAVDPASGAPVLDWSLRFPSGGEAESIGFFTVMAVAAVGPLFSSDAWNYVTFIGGEVKDPSKTLPKALTIGAALVVTLYVLANLAYINVLSLEQIQSVPDDKVAALMMTHLFGDLGGQLMALIILVSTFGCLNGLLLAGARVFYSMAKDGLLFSSFARLHPKTHTPNLSMWAQCLWAIGLGLSGTYGQLLSYIVFTALLFYIVTLAGLLPLLKKVPTKTLQLSRPIDWAMPILYITGATILSAYMLIGEKTFMTSLIGVGFTLSGLPAYFIWQKVKPQAV